MSCTKLAQSLKFQVVKLRVSIITVWKQHTLFIVYEQQYIRTMFFDKVEKKSIDGTMYEISNGT